MSQRSHSRHKQPGSNYSSLDTLYEDAAPWRKRECLGKVEEEKKREEGHQRQEGGDLIKTTISGCCFSPLNPSMAKGQHMCGTSLSSLISACPIDLAGKAYSGALLLGNAILWDLEVLPSSMQVLCGAETPHPR